MNQSERWHGLGNVIFRFANENQLEDERSNGGTSAEITIETGLRVVGASFTRFFVLEFLNLILSSSQFLRVMMSFSASSDVILCTHGANGDQNAKRPKQNLKSSAVR